MALKIHNSEKQKLEEFVPLTPGQVKMYVCGPTVYNLLHVGNFRGVVFFNLVRHWLEYLGFKVEYLLNFTDVDDKIIQKALEEKTTPTELSERYIAEYKKDFASLGLTPHEANPKVTENIDSILQMVSQLITEGKAYESQGSVLYSIESFADYGRLSGRNPEQLLAGVRIEADTSKKNPLDFALWKSAKPGEPAWESPWGPGRPGWHIECSAMIQSHFGEQIDIHGGGMDLIFPHHENEIAQSEGCSHKVFVKYWMHNNMLNFAGQKMSKSLGNILSLREFLQQYPAEVYKWMMLSVHYRSVCEFSDSAIEKSIAGLARIYSALAVAEEYVAMAGWNVPSVGATDFAAVSDAKLAASLQQEFALVWTKICEKMNDDFATPEVVAIVFEQVRLFNAKVKRGLSGPGTLKVAGPSLLLVILLKKLGSLMSLFQQPGKDFLFALDDLLLKKRNLQRSEIDRLVQERWQVRLNKDFKRSDELRDQLTALGILVSDTAAGSFWEVAKAPS
ncbi:MAG: cysteine--tRNA ligase [Pseudobdellovibrionaceae bacterium]